MFTQEKNTPIKVIMIIGKFNKLHDEEYIARSFESLGHDVIRIPQNTDPTYIHRKILLNKPDIVLFTKYVMPKPVRMAIERGKEWNIKTVCWLFDLYWGYIREFRLKSDNYFKSDYVFTTDGGEHAWKDLGINHNLLRQGIYKNECFLIPFQDINYEVLFVGSESPAYPERSKLVKELGAKWFGSSNTDELRGMALNRIYASTRIVIGDSYYSPNYWSNRVVETLGRGGFLIHQEVEGLKEEYPYLVTYEKGNIQDLKNKIEYYKTHEEERRDIIRKNFDWVRDNYTMDKKCAELLEKIYA